MWTGWTRGLGIYPLTKVYSPRPWSTSKLGQPFPLSDLPSAIALCPQNRAGILTLFPMLSRSTVQSVRTSHEKRKRKLLLWAPTRKGSDIIFLVVAHHGADTYLMSTHHPWNAIEGNYKGALPHSTGFLLLLLYPYFLFFFFLFVLCATQRWSSTGSRNIDYGHVFGRFINSMSLWRREEQRGTLGTSG